MAKEYGVKIPESVNIEDENILTKINIGYPCIIKPADTILFTEHFRQKYFYVRMKVTYKKGLKNAKKIVLKLLFNK